MSKEIQNYFISGIYSAIFAVHLQCRASKGTDNIKQNIIFYALCVLYVLCAVVFALDTTGVWISLFVSINELLFELCADQLYRAMMSLWRGALRLSFSPQYSVAATSSPNVFLYALLTNPFHSICLFSLQRYTVAGLCGVAISM